MELSPLTVKYKSRLNNNDNYLKERLAKKQKISIPISNTTEIDVNGIPLTLVSSKSAGSTIKRENQLRIQFDQNAPQSDRFIPFRSGNNSKDCFNMNDKYSHSPLSLMKNSKNKQKSIKSTQNDALSQTNQKYDSCLQHLLLLDKDNNHNNYTKKPENYHLSDCMFFEENLKNKKNSKNITKNHCICKYILNERISYNNSPKKVYKFNYDNNNEHKNDNKDNSKNSKNTNLNLSFLPNSINNIMNNDINSSNILIDGVSIQNQPIKTIKLTKMQKRKNKKAKINKLKNDYYYHLMDFKINHNFGVIALGDKLHFVHHHFGDFDDAEKLKFGINTNRNNNGQKYHFCSVKLSPNYNQYLLSIGDVNGKLFLYDYIKQKLSTVVRKSNSKRISVIDWNNHSISVGSLDRIIRIYDDRYYKSLLKLRYHKGEVCGLKWNKYNKYLLLSGGNQNRICYWDIRKPNKPLFVGTHNAAIRALSFYPDSTNKFISGGGSNDQSIKIWDINNGSNNKCVNSLLTGSQVCNLEYLQHNKRNYLISTHGFSSNSIKIWHINNNELIQIKQLCSHKCRVLFLSKYSDCNIVTASPGPDQTMKYWKIFPMQTKSPFIHHKPHVIR